MCDGCDYRDARQVALASGTHRGFRVAALFLFFGQYGGGQRQFCLEKKMGRRITTQSSLCNKQYTSSESGGGVCDVIFRLGTDCTLGLVHEWVGGGCANTS